MVNYVSEENSGIRGCGRGRCSISLLGSQNSQFRWCEQLSPLAKPLAGEKLNKRLHRVVKKGTSIGRFAEESTD